jgi:RNA polymerase sigma-70 factor, ECF subfamily
LGGAAPRLHPVATLSFISLYYNLEMSSRDERALVVRAVQGDHDAFDELVGRHQQAVYNVAYRVLGNVHDAEDAAQDTFIRAYKFMDKFDDSRPLAPWLKRIAVNVCLNRLEAQKPAVPLDDEMAQPPDPNPGPEGRLIAKDRNERIRAELKRLPPRYRAVIELRHFQELSYEEAARELKRPVSDIKSDLFRARKLLAERLRDLN